MARKKCISRATIVSEIRRVGAELGRSPRRLEFAVRTGISEHFLSPHFARWNDALREAGQEIYYRAARHDSEPMEDWARVARKLKKVPTRHEYALEGRFGAGTFNKRFGNWGEIPRLFRDFAATRPEWTDVVQIIDMKELKLKRRWSLMEEMPQAAQWEGTSWRGTGGVASGDPINFEHVRNAPVNESGVIFLFGLVSARLGYVIEGIQSRFPDCEAKLKCEDGKWRRVRIEFEYESLNFVRHGHDVNGCDVIVCWRHNWAECPMKVIELSSELARLGKVGSKTRLQRGRKVVARGRAREGEQIQREQSGAARGKEARNSS